MRELWAELSATMRALRTNAGMSLRRVELESGVGRGTLSQIETAKARPNRDVVEWYDTALGGDGLLLTLFAEARGAHGPMSRRVSMSAIDPNDRLVVVSNDPPHGALVATGASVDARWTLRNTGTVPWRGRCLERAGARGGLRLIASDAAVAVPDTPPGAEVDVSARLVMPNFPATYAAGWQMIDGDGRLALPFDNALSVHLVTRSTS